MHATLLQAISEQRVLIFTYDNQPRTVEPHAYGESAKGNKLLRGFQTAGGSNSGGVPGWHLFSVGKIQNLAVTSETFAQPHDGYKQGDSAMAVIYAQL